MSLWSTLDNAVTSSIGVVAQDAGSVVDTVLSNVHVILTTNLTGDVDLGGVASAPQTDPSTGQAIPGSGGGGGLLGLLGVRFSVRAVNADGGTIASAGTPPAFSPVLAGVYLLGAGLLTYTLYRGFASYFK